MNLKYGVTSNLTFDFTYNPDFSQIESDRQQIEINQRFPVLYPELRPFFLEGQEIFRVPGPVTFIHTRTIVDPRYGAKLSGKIGKTTLGLLVANDEAPGKVDNRQDPRVWADGAVRRRARPLRSVPRVDGERHLHESRVHEPAQPRDWRRRRLCVRSDAPVLRARHRDRPSRCRRRAAQGLLLRLQSAEGRPQRQLLAHQQRHQPRSAHRCGVRAPHRSAADARQHLVSLVAGNVAHQLGAAG